MAQRDPDRPHERGMYAEDRLGPEEYCAREQK